MIGTFCKKQGRKFESEINLINSFGLLLWNKYKETCHKDQEYIYVGIKNTNNSINIFEKIKILYTCKFRETCFKVE